MIDGLIAGKLHGQPQQRTGPSCKPFTTAKVRTSTKDDGTVFVNASAFGSAKRRNA